MFRRMITQMGFPAIAGFGLLRVGGPAKADEQASNRSYDGVFSPSPFGSYSPYYYRTYGRSVGRSTDPQANAAKLQPSPEEMSVSRLLTASGVPNDKGQLRWPIGLAILAAPGAEELCEQIDALFEEMAIQAASGPVSPTLAEEARQTVKELRRLLLKEKAERFGMSLAVYKESERFLDKLDRAARLLRAGMATPGGQRRSRTEGSSTSESTGSLKK
jgi:hypothetical protein